MKLTTTSAMLPAAVLATAATIASAAVPAVTKSNGDFINGSDIPSNNFTVASGGGVEVALKARGFTALSGQPVSYDGISEYTVKSGYAGGRGPTQTPGNTRAWWTFDYQFTPAAGTLPASYVLRLEQDVNPAADEETYFVTQGLPSGFISGGAQFDDDGYKVNPGNGAWTSDVIPFVHSQSWNYEFDFYPTSYDPTEFGEYKINLTAYLSTDLDFDTPLASTSINVVVPEPTTLAALAGASVLGLRRRRRA